MRLLTLGGVELRLDDGRQGVAVLSQKKRIAVLCFLALREPRAFVQRNVLASMFWPDADETKARTALRNMLYHMRNELGAAAILTHGDEAIALNPDVVWCDAVAFTQAVEAHNYERALTLYRGDLLEGFLPPELPEFADWIDRQRHALHTQAVQCAKALAEDASEEDATSAVPWARKWVTLSPYEEPAIRALIHVLIASGDRAGAVRAFDDWKQRLRADLNAEPTEQTARLLHSAQRAAPAPVPASNPAPAHTPVSTRSRAWRRVAALALSAIAISTAAYFTRGEPAPADVAIAVLPFTYGGSADYRYLREGFVDLVSARLAHNGLHAADPRSVVAHTDRIAGAAGVDPIKAAGIAKQLGASFFVLGSLLEVNGKLQLSASLYSARTGARSLEEVNLSGSVDSVFQIADAATAALLRARSLREFAEAGRTWQSDTESVEAMQAFVEGENAYNAGRFEEATIAYARAIKADPDFARAHLRYSIAATWLGQNGDAMYEPARRAMELRARLSPDDIVLAEAWNAHLGAKPMRADSLYQDYLRRHPENPDAWLQLGEVRYHWGTSFGIAASEAKDAFERALRLMPNAVPALMHSIRIAGRNGDARTVEQLTARLNEVKPRAQERIEALAILALAQHDTAALRAIAQRAGTGEYDAKALVQVLAGATADAATLRAFLLEPPVRDHVDLQTYHTTLINTFAATADYDGAEAAARRLGRTLPALGFEHRCNLAVLPWRKPDAARDHALLRELPRHVALVPTPRRMRCEALLRLQLGDAAGASRIADQLETYRGDDLAGRSATHEQHLIRARVALATGQVGAAWLWVKDSHMEPNDGYPIGTSFSSALERYTRAEVLMAMRNYDVALIWVETFPDHTGYDIAFVAPARVLRRTIEARLRS